MARQLYLINLGYKFLLLFNSIVLHKLLHYILSILKVSANIINMEESKLENEGNNYLITVELYFSF